MESFPTIERATERVSRALSELELARQQRDDAIVQALDVDGSDIGPVQRAAGMSAQATYKARDRARARQAQIIGQTSLVTADVAQAALADAPQRPRRRGGNGRRI